MESQAPYRTLQPGEMLNWYRIERILGRGGFGVIYLATDTNLDHQVAVKEYIPGDVATRTGDSKVHPITEEHGDMFRWGMERFIKEARNLVKFKHPNIVRVMSVFQENNTAYMVMEFEEGEDLRSYLRKPNANSERSLKQLILPISKGLAEVHRHGFIHRDIKPANILVRNDGSPVLLDFGSARNASKFTHQSLTALVSVGYAPLEQYNSEADEQQGPWTDIYALGGTLYNAISGRDPVESTRRGAALLNGGADPQISAEYLGEGKYSKGFLRAIDWAMSFAIADRPQSLSDWMPALLADDTDLLADGSGSHDVNSRSDFDTKTMNELADATVLSRERRTAGFDGGQAQSPQTLSSSNPSKAPVGSGLRGLAFLTLLLSGVALSLWFVTSERDTAPRVNTQPVIENPAETKTLAQGESAAEQQAQEEALAAQALREQAQAEQERQAAAEKAAAEEAQRLQAEQAQAAERVAEQQAAQALQDAALAAEKAKADAIAKAAADALAAEQKAAQELAEKQAAEEAEKERVREAQIAARQAAARQERRLKQAIAAAQNSLSVGDLTAAQQQLSNAQRIDANDPRVETLAFAVQTAQEAHDQPVSDADFDSVTRMFDALRRAIESNDAVTLDRLAISSQQSAIFKSLMKSFERIDVSIANIRVRNADKSISGILRIDAMVRENGDTATPSDKYATRTITSRRVNGGWSKIQW